MKAKEENGTTKVYPNLTTAYRNVLNGYELMAERHEADGFFDVIEPELLTNEKHGEIYFDERLNAFTYPVEQIIIIEPTADEIENQKIQQLILLKQEYSQRISDIIGLREALERFAMDGEPIPYEIIEQRTILIQEYESRKLELQ